MAPIRTVINRSLMLGAGCLAVASIVLNDVDKLPIYVLLTYVFWRLG